MNSNSVFSVVFWSSLFGAIMWLPAFLPMANAIGFHISWSGTNFHQQVIIMIKGIMMTLSWLFAYYAIRSLPMSFSGAIRASGPLWTLIGGAIVFGDWLSPVQAFSVIISMFSYFALSCIGKKKDSRFPRVFQFL